MASGSSDARTFGWRIATIGDAPVSIARSWLLLIPLIFLGAPWFLSRRPELGVLGAYAGSAASAGAVLVSVLAHDSSIAWGITGRRSSALIAVGWWGRGMSVLLLIGILVLISSGRLPVDPRSYGIAIFSMALALAWQLWLAGTHAIRRSAFV